MEQWYFFKVTQIDEDVSSERIKQLIKEVIKLNFYLVKNREAFCQKLKLLIEACNFGDDPEHTEFKSFQDVDFAIVQRDMSECIMFRNTQYDIILIAYLYKIQNEFT